MLTPSVNSGSSGPIVIIRSPTVGTRSDLSAAVDVVP